MIKAIIIEDEKLSAGLLAKMIQDHCPEINLVAIAYTIEEALDKIKSHAPDLIFLDIELQTGTGFDILNNTTNYSYKVIFTTAYDHYALKAIKFSAIDYLLKPIDVLELKEAIKKISTESKIGPVNNLEILMKNLIAQTNHDFSISLSTSEGTEIIPIKTILKLEADGPYTHFYLKNNKKLIISKNLKEYENLLQDHDFFRVHNSYIINIHEVKRILKSDGGYVVLNDDSQVPISPKKKDDLMGIMQSRLV